MDKIQEIDKAITINVNNIKEQIGKLSFETICDFKPNKIHIPEIPWGSLNYPGIYLIEIKNDNKFDSFKPWIEDFQVKWENEKYLRHFTPNLKKKRIVKHNELKEWMPLYIGKSKRIEGRVHEHIFIDLHKSTFALKINSRENMRNETFRLKTIKCEVENYDIILPIIESELRNKINPLIGKQ